MPTRLAIAGSRLLLGDADFRPVGVTVTRNDYIPGDMALVAALGANMVRLNFLWYNGLPLSGGDAYDPHAPGNFDVDALATLRAMVAEAQAAGLWVDIAVAGCAADFWTNPTLQLQHAALWGFLAGQFADQPLIMGYELLVEPHPAPDDNPLVAAIYTAAIIAARAADPATPMMIGAGPDYDIRYLWQILLPLPNIVYVFNWFEPTAFVKEARSGAPADWTTYPGTFVDTKGQKADCPGNYPGKGATDTIDAAWLAGLLSVALTFRDANNVPIWVDQVGVDSLAPGSSAWLADSLAALDGHGVGWCLWVLRSPKDTGSIGDPFGANNSGGGQGLYYQEEVVVGLGVDTVWVAKTPVIALVTAAIAQALAPDASQGSQTAMTLSPGDLVPLNGLVALPRPAGTDLLPILRTSPLQYTTAAGLQAFTVNSVFAYGAVGDGVTDDTVAIQAAINAGLPFFFPPGVYLTSATLTFTSAASHGQVARGAGPTASDGTGTSKAIIRPTAAVQIAVQIDGTPFAGYVQGFGLEDITIDMVNMVDVSASIGVNQVQAFDSHYDNVRVINFGLYKISWLFNAGSYTSRLSDCQGGLICFQGIGYTNQTTSIVLMNCDIYSIAHAYFTNVTLIGGAVQQPYTTAVPIVYLPPGTTPYAYLPNTAGLYAAVLSDLTNSYSFTSVGCDWEQGGEYPATYNDGTHGTLTLIRVLRVQSTCLNTTFVNPTFAGMYLLDYGLNTRVTGQALGSAAGIDITTGSQFNFGDLRSMGGIYGISNFANYLNVGSGVTFSIDGGTGNANFNKTTISPSVDGDGILYVKNASGLPLYDFTTNGAGFALLSGTLISGYTDSFTTQSWIIDSSMGSAKFRSLSIIPSTDGNSVVLWKNAAGTVLVGYNTNATPSSSSLYFENGISLNGFSDGGTNQTWSANSATGNVTAKSLQVGATAPPTGGISTNTQIRTVGGTFAALPAPATIGNGARGFITDGTVTASGNFGASITAGGGSNQIPVYSDGMNWRIG